MKSFRASSEAVLGTLKYVQCMFLMKSFRASNEANLGTLKYCPYSQTALDVGRVSKEFSRASMMTA